MPDKHAAKKLKGSSFTNGHGKLLRRQLTWYYRNVTLDVAEDITKTRSLLPCKSAGVTKKP